MESDIRGLARGGSLEGLGSLFALWNFIIRPPRTTYTAEDLGPSEFQVGGQRAMRKDLKLRSSRGVSLACSHFTPKQDRDDELQQFPVVIYLHGNSSNRLEAGSLVAEFISRRISLFCFDAAGCGLSGGEYVSLGWYERDDLATVVKYLRTNPECGPIGIWGRSMGAATALLHADRDPTLGAICLDSSYADFRMLAEDFAQSYAVMFPIPDWLLTAALSVVRSKVQKLADFDIDHLVPLNHAKRSTVPALFMHATGDTLIPHKHSQLLSDAYFGEREFMTVDGDHNSPRSESVNRYAINFFCRQLSFASRGFDSSVQTSPVVHGASAHRVPPWKRRSLPKMSMSAKPPRADISACEILKPRACMEDEHAPEFDKGGSDASLSPMRPESSMPARRGGA
mmetsp:Transcript_45293/g.98484  ORF Transcript_45293/g.98484 Transcript_45293/m.98484 type:complete len:397 (+) Transcript_45293:40-1230(+)